MNRNLGAVDYLVKLRIIWIWAIVLLVVIQFSSLIEVTNNTYRKNDDAVFILPSNPKISISQTNNESGVSSSSTSLISTKASFPFSACLIIKDDNIILPEWLAYHYTVLPLRRLIVGVDPLSYTDPTSILHAFQDSTGMNITIWKNDSFWKDKKEFRITENTTYDELRIRKRNRQNKFYEACLSQLRAEKQTWTMMIDVDEYLAFNYLDEAEKEAVKKQELNVSDTRIQLDNQSSSTTIADVVSRWDIDQDLACVTFARYLVPSKEDDNNMTSSIFHHSDFNATLFHTLRYRRRVPLRSPQPGKSIVDASRYDNNPIDNPHRIKSLCTGSNVWPNNNKMPFRVLHYVGSWEAFRSIGFDPRGRSYFDKRNNEKKLVEDNTMTTWLDKFALLVGSKEKAIELTEATRLREEAASAMKFLEQTLLTQEHDWGKLNEKPPKWT